jgi:hypothetical protein
LFDDVKKKVQKNLRARTNRSTPRRHLDANTIDTHVDLDFRLANEVPSRSNLAGRDGPHRVAHRLIFGHARAARSTSPSPLRNVFRSVGANLTIVSKPA